MNTALVPTPWLSVLMPVHNAAPFFEAALAQVMSQLPPDAELLLVDDGSSDGSEAVAAALAQRHAPQVRLFRHPTPLGVSAARNRLLDEARGDHLWFLDADDLLQTGSMDRLRDLLDAQGPLDVVLLDYSVLRPQPRLKHRLRGEHHRRTSTCAVGRPLSGPELMAGTLARGQWHLWSKVFRRGVWPADLRFPTGRVFEDVAVCPRVLAHCQRGWAVGQAWVAYRSNPHSILGRMDLQKWQDWVQALAAWTPPPGAEEGPAGAQAKVARAWRLALARQWLRVWAQAQRLGVPPALRLQAVHTARLQLPQGPLAGDTAWRHPQLAWLAWAWRVGERQARRVEGGA